SCTACGPALTSMCSASDGISTGGAPVLVAPRGKRGEGLRMRFPPSERAPPAPERVPSPERVLPPEVLARERLPPVRLPAPDPGRDRDAMLAPHGIFAPRPNGLPPDCVYRSDEWNGPRSPSKPPAL